MDIGKWQMKRLDKSIDDAMKIVGEKFGTCNSNSRYKPQRCVGISHLPKKLLFFSIPSLCPASSNPILTKARVKNSATRRVKESPIDSQHHAKTDIGIFEPFWHL